MLRETILILGNPNTNKKKVNRIIDEIISILSEGKILNECFRETWINQINSYKEVWVIGGDGTLNYFLNFYKNILFLFPFLKLEPETIFHGSFMEIFL